VITSISIPKTPNTLNLNFILSSDNIRSNISLPIKNKHLDVQKSRPPRSGRRSACKKYRKTMEKKKADPRKPPIEDMQGHVYQHELGDPDRVAQIERSLKRARGRTGSAGYAAKK
jgi:hypothetical protein